MSISIEIKDGEEKIAKEIEKELREKYGEKIGRVAYYPSGSLNIAKLGLSIVQAILIFLKEDDREYALFKGIEAGLREYIKYSEKEEEKDNI
jgi:hypothetical protein